MNDTEHNSSTTADHDLLIRLDTKFDLLSGKFDKLSDNIVSRVDELERKDAAAEQVAQATTKDVTDLKRDVNFLNRYAWIAIGALGIIEIYLMYRQARP